MTDKVFISKENLEKALSFKEKKDVGFFTSILSTLLKIIVPIEILVSSFVFLITTDASSNSFFLVRIRYCLSFNSLWLLEIISFPL